MFKSVLGFDYDNIGGGYTPQTQFVTGSGEIFDIGRSGPMLPPVSVPTFSIGSYTPGYQFGGASQSNPTARDSLAGGKIALIALGLLGAGAALYLAGKK